MKANSPWKRQLPTEGSGNGVVPGRQYDTIDRASAAAAVLSIGAEILPRHTTKNRLG